MKVFDFKVKITHNVANYCRRHVDDMSKEDIDNFFKYYCGKYSYLTFLFKYPFTKLTMENFYTEEEINKLKS
jgi:hypothetical protein